MRNWANHVDADAKPNRFAVAWDRVLQLCGAKLGGSLPKGASRRARAVRLGPTFVNQVAPAWAGARIAPVGGGQARPDLTRVKSG